MKPWQRWLWGAALAYSVAHVGYSVVRYNVFNHLSSGDFYRVHQEAINWAEGIRRSPSATYAAESGNWHPPLYFGILLTLGQALGGRQPLAYFLYFLQFPLFVVAIRWMAQAASLDRHRTGPLTRYPVSDTGLTLLAAVLALNFQPLLETLAQHKVEGIEFALICLAIAAYRRKRDFLCGAAVAVAANLKYLPGILAVYFLVKREYRVLLGMLVTQAALMAVLGWAYGWEMLRFAFLQHPYEQLFLHTHEGTSSTASVEMQTLTGAVHRLLARPAPGQSYIHYIIHESYMPVPRLELVQRTLLGARLLLAAVWVAFITRRRIPPQEREERWPRILLEISFTLVMIPVLSQGGRVHYGILLLPAFVFAALVLLQRRERFGTAPLAVLAAAYALSAMAIPGGFLNKLPPMPVWENRYSDLYLWLSLPFYGYALLGAWLLAASRTVPGLRPGTVKNRRNTE